MAGNPNGRSIGAALFLIAGVLPLPIGASIITTLIHISPAPKPLLQLQMRTIGTWLSPQWTTIAVGLLLTLILWIVLAAFTRNTTTVDSVNAVSALHLKNHITTLCAAFAALPQPGSTPTASSPLLTDQPQYLAAYKQVEAYKHDIEEEIASRDVRWVTARGYLKAWNLVHRAEEAMIILMPSDEVIREALHDEMSIKGSGMDAEADALRKLRRAVVQLSPSAAVYLNTVENVTSAPAGSTGAGSSIQLEMEARDALRDVRRTLNEYRDRLWEGLVNQRNQLMGTTFITGLFTYLLLVFAIISNASQMAIEATMAYYLAGALSGLFIRMYNESQAGKAVDDFNLTTARIFVTPFISGLAAVGGILLLATLTITLTQSSINTSAATAIADAFNLTKNGLGIVLATVFGYAPNLFINTLQQRAQEVTTQLQNSTPQSQGTAAAGTATQLAITPAALTFSGYVGQPNPPAQPLKILNNGGDTMTWQATEKTTDGGMWLGVDHATGSLPANQTDSLTVTAVVTGLQTGTYTGTITITGTDSSGKAVAGSPQSIPVTLTVSPPSCTITVAPTALNFAGIVGQPDPSPQSATITASSACANPVTWSATSATTPPGVTWLMASPVTGSINQSAAATIQVKVSLTSLTADTYHGTVTISATDSVTNISIGTPQVIQITLTVTASATLTLSTTNLSFTVMHGGSNPPDQPVTLTNTGGDDVQWTVGTPSATWVSVTPQSGRTSAGASSPLTFSVDITGLAANTYTATVPITPSVGSPATVTVLLTVNPAQPPMP